MQNNTQRKQSSQTKGADQKVSADRRATSNGSGGRSASTNASGRSTSAGTGGRSSPANVSGRAPSGGAVRSGSGGHAVEDATSRRPNKAGASSARSSGFATTGGARQSTTHSAKGARRHAQMKRTPYSKRRGRRPFPRRALLIGLGAVLVVALIIALIVNASRGTHHMLPTVKRIEDYTPEPASPEATVDGGSEQGIAPEEGAADDAATAEPVQLPEEDGLTDAADFSAEPDIPAQDADTAETIAWNDAAAGVDPPDPPCEGGLLELRYSEGGLWGVCPCEGRLLEFRAASIYQHISPATPQTEDFGLSILAEDEFITGLLSQRTYREAVEA